MNLFRNAFRKKTTGYQNYSNAARKVKNRTKEFKHSVGVAKRNARRHRGIFKI
jgi:hypothetical protein